MLALSTRTATTARQGLAAGLREVLPLDPEGLLLETSGVAGPLDALIPLLRSANVPVLGLQAPLPSEKGDPGPTLDAAEPSEQRAAVAAVVQALELLARVRGRRLVIGFGDGGIPGAEQIRRELSEGKADAAALVAWRAERHGLRAATVERICRSLHGLLRRSGGAELVLVPSADPVGLLDLETAGWLLEDLGRRGLGLAWDLGVLGLRDAQGVDPLVRWIGETSAHARMILLADHDGRERADLLPGAGLLDLGALRSELSRQIPWVLRPDPEAGAAELRESAALLRDRLGPLPGLGEGA